MRKADIGKKIKKLDRTETTFDSHNELYWFIRMPDRHRNASRPFQKTIVVINATVRRQFALVYMDDTVLFCKTLEKYMLHIRETLILLNNAGVTFQLEKCQFTATIDYLGHGLRSERAKITSHMIDALRGLQKLCDITESWFFLGLCDVYQRFVPNFARLMTPLNKNLWKDKPAKFWSLYKEELAVMNTLNGALVLPPGLFLLNSTGRVMLDTDACHK